MFDDQWVFPCPGITKLIFLTFKLIATSLTLQTIFVHLSNHTVSSKGTQKLLSLTLSISVCVSLSLTQPLGVFRTFLSIITMSHQWVFSGIPRWESGRNILSI